MSRILMTCRDCHQRQRVSRHLLDRAAQPRCRHCGGPLEASAAATASLGETHDRQRGQAPPTGRRRRAAAPEPVRLIPSVPMARHEWGEHPDLYRTLIRTQADIADELRRIGPAEFYRRDLEGAANRRRQGLLTDAGNSISLLGEAEQAWYVSGSPYYKVWPSIAAALQHTQVRIEGKNLHMPQTAFEVRLPLDDNPLAPCRAILAARIEGDGWTDGRDWSLVIIFTDGLPDSPTTQTWIADMPVRPDQLLEDSLDETALQRDCPNPGLARAVMRVVVGVSFFGTDRHELVLPDLPRKVIERYQRERRQPSEEEARRLLTAAREDRGRGWKVGSEIELPRPLVRLLGERPHSDGRSLEHGHIRRGHLRQQRCGVGLQETRIVFVAPCLVRPELGLESQQGYRVRPSSGVEWEPSIGKE